MLAQLLLKFQNEPIIGENALQNVTNQSAIDTFNNNYLNYSTTERIKRSIPSTTDNEVPRDPENLIVKESFIASDSTGYGKTINIIEHSK